MSIAFESPFCWRMAEYYDVKNWEDDKLKGLQLSEIWLKPKDGLKTRELVEEEKKNEEDGWENILDPLSKTYKRRPKKTELSLQVGEARRNLIMKAVCQ